MGSCQPPSLTAALKSFYGSFDVRKTLDYKQSLLVLRDSQARRNLGCVRKVDKLCSKSIDEIFPLERACENVKHIGGILRALHAVQIADHHKTAHPF